MTFAWPWALPLLLAVPVLGAAYLWQLRRRRREAVRHPSVAMVRAAAPPSRRWRRHAPAALVLFALCLLGLAAARPQVEAQVPVRGGAVIMAVDVSGSMCATDVDPNRLTAAQEAVRTVRLDDRRTTPASGWCVFSGFAQVAVAPTTDREPVLDAIDTLTTGRGTVIGAAILKSIDAIAEINPDVSPASTDDLLVPHRPPPRRQVAPEIVVLLTDGANTRGVTPETAARPRRHAACGSTPSASGPPSPSA